MAGRSDEAMRDLERLSTSTPQRSAAGRQRGDILRMKQHFADCRRAYDRAIARNTLPAAPTGSCTTPWRGRGTGAPVEKAEADSIERWELIAGAAFVLNYLGYSWADMAISGQGAR